jgi:hypothetical protein
MSYVEIYNEVIRDLLLPNCKDTYLDLRDDADKGVILTGVTEFTVNDQGTSLIYLTLETSEGRLRRLWQTLRVHEAMQSVRSCWLQRIKSKIQRKKSYKVSYHLSTWLVLSEALLLKTEVSG